jgi:hypothetical protein
MKTKILLSTILFLFAILGLNAQNLSFDKGNHVLNVGIGLGNARYSSGATSSIPPISASYEVGVVNNVFDKASIGVGGYLGYTSAKWDFGGGYSVKSSDFIIGVRGALHYPLVDKLDTYAGLMIAYDINSWTTTGTYFAGASSSSYGGIFVPGFIGARYFFSEKFAGFAELGWGIAYLNLGVAIKIK